MINGVSDDRQDAIDEASQWYGRLLDAEPETLDRAFTRDAAAHPEEFEIPIRWRLLDLKW